MKIKSTHYQVQIKIFEMAGCVYAQAKGDHVIYHYPGVIGLWSYRNTKKCRGVGTSLIDGPDRLRKLETCLSLLEIVLEADPRIACPVVSATQRHAGSYGSHFCQSRLPD